MKYIKISLLFEDEETGKKVEKIISDNWTIDNTNSEIILDEVSEVISEQLGSVIKPEIVKDFIKELEGLE